MNIDKSEFMNLGSDDRREVIKEYLDGDIGGFEKLLKNYEKSMKVKTSKSLYTKKQESRSDIKKRRKKNKNNKKRK